MTISRDEARRIALGAQGFGTRRPAQPNIAHVRALATRINGYQIDSVNVLVRAHYMPAFSRLGPYPLDAIDRLAYERRALFEYWAHAACLVPVELYPLMRWRMDTFTMQPFVTDHTYAKAVLEEVAEHGPISAAELSDPGTRKGAWWGWAEGKAALEWLYSSGQVAIAGRRNFERLYDLTERVIPRPILDTPPPPPDEAKKRLLVEAARALGVGTARDLTTYFNIDPWWHRPKAGKRRAPSRTGSLLTELVQEKRLLPAKVDGWRHPAYLHPDAKVPRAVEARALVSPFDPLIWERDRIERLFDFAYRIEIYVPAGKREYGYYVLPFLLGDRFVGRVDLKADRKRRTLLVPAAFSEPGTREATVARALTDTLHEVATWLSLDRIEIGERGDLARPLARALRSSPA